MNSIGCDVLELAQASLKAFSRILSMA